MQKKNDWLDLSLEGQRNIFSDFPISIVDIGASNSPPQNCLDIATISTYLGFDPDLREPQENHGFDFLRRIIVDKAVISLQQDYVEFYLTKYPQCSSTLCPDENEYKHYSVSPFFDVVDRVKIPSITLENALKSSHIKYIDWLKLDTQGTDLDILKSLDPLTINKLLAVDLEPGVTSFYNGENRFSDIHEYMLGNGFWLANLSQQRFPRISDSTVKKLSLTNEEIHLIGDSPFAFELQYFRNLDFLAKQNISFRDLFAFWILAMTNSHFAFAIEIAMFARQLELGDELSDKLVSITLQLCRHQNEIKKGSFLRNLFTLISPPIFFKLLRKLKRLRNLI